MSNLQELYARSFETAQNGLDRAEEVGAAALRKIGLSREKSERFVDFASRSIGLLAVTALGVGVAETTSYGIEKGSAVVVEVDKMFHPDSYQIPNLVDQHSQDALNPSEYCPAGSKLIVGKSICSIK